MFTLNLSCLCHTVLGPYWTLFNKSHCLEHNIHVVEEDEATFLVASCNTFNSYKQYEKSVDDIYSALVLPFYAKRPF